MDIQNETLFKTKRFLFQRPFEAFLGPDSDRPAIEEKLGEQVSLTIALERIASALSL